MYNFRGKNWLWLAPLLIMSMAASTAGAEVGISQDAYLASWGLARYDSPPAWAAYLGPDQTNTAAVAARAALLPQARAYAKALGAPPRPCLGRPDAPAALLLPRCDQAEHYVDNETVCVRGRRAAGPWRSLQFYVRSPLGRTIKCHLTLPPDAAGPAPLLVALHQSTYDNVDEPVGLAGTNDYAGFFAGRGFITLTPQIMGFARQYSGVTRG